MTRSIYKRLTLITFESGPGLLNTSHMFVPCPSLSQGPPYTVSRKRKWELMSQAVMRLYPGQTAQLTFWLFLQCLHTPYKSARDSLLTFDGQLLSAVLSELLGHCWVLTSHLYNGAWTHRAAPKHSKVRTDNCMRMILMKILLTSLRLNLLNQSPGEQGFGAVCEVGLGVGSS